MFPWLPLPIQGAAFFIDHRIEKTSDLYFAMIRSLTTKAMVVMSVTVYKHLSGALPLCTNQGYPPNASYWGIRAYFQGHNDKGKMNVKNEELEYMRRCIERGDGTIAVANCAQSI